MANHDYGWNVKEHIVGSYQTVQENTNNLDMLNLYPRCRGTSRCHITVPGFCHTTGLVCRSRHSYLGPGNLSATKNCQIGLNLCSLIPGLVHNLERSSLAITPCICASLNYRSSEHHAMWCR